MKKYKCILFDLDGTLINTFPGTVHSYQYAAAHIGIPIPTEQIVSELISIPLLEVFRKRFFLSEDMIEKAVYFYRKYYAENGLHEVVHYDGMLDTLIELKKRGYLLGVATLKKEFFAKTILFERGLMQYFDIVVGMDDKDVLTKSEMIKKTIVELDILEKDTLLVGDSCYDALGAKEANVDFIAVTYGFGFRSTEEVVAYNHVGIIHTPSELLIYI